MMWLEMFKKKKKMSWFVLNVSSKNLKILVCALEGFSMYTDLIFMSDPEKIDDKVGSKWMNQHMD